MVLLLLLGLGYDGHELQPVQAARWKGRPGRLHSRPYRKARPRISPNQQIPPPPLRLIEEMPAAPPPPPSISAESVLAPNSQPAALHASAVSDGGTETETEVIACHPDRQSAEPKVLCSDGKSWTLRSAGLILPPVLRCSSEFPECCQVGFRKMRDVQLDDLVRVGQGQPPLCHMRVKDFVTNPPSRLANAPDRLDDELPPGLRISKDCPKGQYLALGACHDPKQLLRALRPPALIDGNRPLVPEADAVVERMRREFDASGQCPQSALDIEVLKRIYHAAQLRAELVADTPLDVTPLLARAQFPGGSQKEPQLPASCGYNATFQLWYQTTFHCASKNTCFAQSHEAMSHTCVQFDRATTESGTSPYFWPMANCQNVPSCIAVVHGDCTGVARLTALGQGIFLMIQEDPSGLPYYYGVLFARPPARSAAALAEAQRAKMLLLDMARNLSSESERTRLRALIDAIPISK